MIRLAGLAFRRRSRLNSNVRPHKPYLGMRLAFDSLLLTSGRWTLALMLSASLVACGSESSGVVRSKLEVSESGVYTLDGTVVSREELKFAVRAKRPENGTLLLHVVPFTRAPFEAVGHAMQAAQYAGAQVGIGGSEHP
jgi:hypothetical protein